MCTHRGGRKVLWEGWLLEGGVWQPVRDGVVVPGRGLIGPHDVIDGRANGPGARFRRVSERQPRRVYYAVVAHQRDGHLKNARTIVNQLTSALYSTILFTLCLIWLSNKLLRNYNKIICCVNCGTVWKFLGVPRHTISREIKSSQQINIILRKK